MMNYKFVLLTIILSASCIISTGITLNAKTIEQKLTAFDSSPFDKFGESVAISDKFVIIGTSHDSYLAEEPSDYTGVLEDAGSVYIYQLNGNAWEFQQKLIPDHPKPDMCFGRSVAIDNDYLAVGAYQENADEMSPSDAYELTQSGAAYIFKYNGTTWVQEARLIPNDPEDDDEFGFSISISGNYVIVGSNNVKPNASAYIFKNNQGSWTQHWRMTTDYDETNYTFARFGYSVSISGDYACVGADQEPYTNEFHSGSAYIFKREGETWVQEKKLIDKNANYKDAFGKSVSISENYVLVGAPSHDGCGKTSGMAFYSIKDETGWSDPIKLSGGDGHVAGIRFGVSVSITDNVAIIGASSAEAIFTYVINDGTFIKTSILHAHDGLDGDSFGACVAMRNERIIVGVPNMHYLSKNGGAYIFTITDYLNGDINDNKVIDIMDAVLLLKNLSTD